MVLKIGKKKYLDDLIISMTVAKVKGVTFLPNLEYIKMKRGEMGVNMVLEEMRKRGYNYDFRKMKKTEWLPAEVRKVFLEATMDALGWDEKRIFDMGVNAPKVSLIMRYFFGLFLTVRKVFEAAPEMWRAHYSSGNLYFKLYEEGHVIMVLENFDISPLFCEYLRGFFKGVANLTKVKNMKVEETKCTFRGDEYHEYTFTWRP